jgi:hypothetical protein
VLLFTDPRLGVSTLQGASLFRANSSTNEQRITAFAYAENDAAGRRVAGADHAGSVMLFAYNGARRLVAPESPADARDAHGGKLAPGSAPAFRQEYYKTINYLTNHSRKAFEVVSLLNSSAIKYSVLNADDAPVASVPLGERTWPSYDSSNHTVYWFPDTGVYWRSWTLGRMNRISPAVVLIHEIGHAYHQAINPAEYSRFTDPKNALNDGRWDKLEEEWDIRNIEDVVERELNQPVRKWHNARFPLQAGLYTSSGPLSVVELTPTQLGYGPYP